MLTDWRIAFLAGCLIIAAIAAIGALSSSNEVTQPAPSGPSVRQRLYGGFLDQARSSLAAGDPDLLCEPDYWLVVSELVPSATASDKALIQFAMGDACAEAGHLGVSPPFSPYYDDR